MRIVDRLLAALLILGAVGHTFGSIKYFSGQPITLLWALCASALAALLGTVNLLRASRPKDRALAWVAAVGTAFWLAASLAFGKLIGNLLDPRVVLFVIISAALIAFSLRTALRRMTFQEG